MLLEQTGYRSTTAPGEERKERPRYRAKTGTVLSCITTP
jgi:hypothetical protein